MISDYSQMTDLMDLTSATLKMPAGLGTVSADAYWQQKLEVAQNVLFCKELFAQVNLLLFDYVNYSSILAFK